MENSVENWVITLLFHEIDAKLILSLTCFQCMNIWGTFDNTKLDTERHKDVNNKFSPIYGVRASIYLFFYVSCLFCPLQFVSYFNKYRIAVAKHAGHFYQVIPISSYKAIPHKWVKWKKYIHSKRGKRYALLQERTQYESYFPPKKIYYSNMKHYKGNLNIPASNHYIGDMKNIIFFY